MLTRQRFVMSKLKKEIKKSLTNLVGEDLGKKIFEANFPKPIINYRSGKILTFKELKELPDDTVIHIYYTDEDDNVREDGFQKLSKEDKDEFCGGGFTIPMTKHESDDDLIENAENSGWHFTIREAIKVSSSEFKKIEKQYKINQRAIKLLDKLRDGKKLTKEEKKDLKKAGIM